MPRWTRIAIPATVGLVAMACGGAAEDQIADVAEVQTTGIATTAASTTSPPAAETTTPESSISTASTSTSSTSPTTTEAPQVLDYGPFTGEMNDQERAVSRALHDNLLALSEDLFVDMLRVSSQTPEPLNSNSRIAEGTWTLEVCEETYGDRVRYRIVTDSTSEWYDDEVLPARDAAIAQLPSVGLSEPFPANGLVLTPLDDEGKLLIESICIDQSTVPEPAFESQRDVIGEWASIWSSAEPCCMTSLIPVEYNDQTFRLDDLDLTKLTSGPADVNRWVLDAYIEISDGDPSMLEITAFEIGRSTACNFMWDRKVELGYVTEDIESAEYCLSDTETGPHGFTLMVPIERFFADLGGTTVGMDSFELLRSYFFEVVEVPIELWFDDQYGEGADLPDGVVALRRLSTAIEFTIDDDGNAKMVKINGYITS